MSLATLVHFAQTSFGNRPWRATTEPPADALGDLPRQSLRETPSIPDWLRTRRPEDEVEVDLEHTWKIHHAVSRPLLSLDVDSVGPDALAFYAPFHLYRDDWGIYIRDVGVKYLACILKGGGLIPGDEAYLLRAEAVLRDHELWHAATEIACTRAEILARRPLYRNYGRGVSASEHEEAMANAHAVRWFHKEGTDERKRLEYWMAQLGLGYRDFAAHVSPGSFIRGKERAVRFMTAALPAPKAHVAGAPHQFLYRGALSYPSMPMRRIVDSTSHDASIVLPFTRDFGLQVLVHSNDHKPAHFHIKRLSDDQETRYLWPALTPYPGNFKLTGKDLRNFREYWRVHALGIEARLEAVYGKHVKI